MKLSIGPVQYFWERQQVLDFYQQVADCPAEIVYLGEVICSKRRLVKPDDWLAIGRELRQSGKEVILSSLTLLEAASEVSSLKKLCKNNEFMVEANDVTAIQLLSRAGTAFVTGPERQHLQPSHPAPAGRQGHETLGSAGGTGPGDPQRSAGVPARRRGDRSVCAGAPAAGLFGTLLHGALAQPAQGQLPVQMPGVPGWPRAENAGRPGVPGTQWHTDPVCADP